MGCGAIAVCSGLVDVGPWNREAIWKMLLSKVPLCAKKGVKLAGL